MPKFFPNNIPFGLPEADMNCAPWPSGAARIQCEATPLALRCCPRRCQARPWRRRVSPI